MKTLIWLCLLTAPILSYRHKKEEHEKTLNNKYFSGPYNCIRERRGTRCPSRRDLQYSQRRHGRPKKAPRRCFSGKDPLTEFFLFTPKNPDRAELLHECGGMLPNNTYFNPKYPTEVFIHGLCDGVCRASGPREIKDQLLFRGKYNVLLVDWTKDSFPDFYDAINAVPDVADRITCVIRNIMRQTGLSRKKLHLVGLGVGAHIAGFVGKRIRGIRRITGLDPGNFGFLDKDCSGRLCRSDACLVDVIHTNGGECVGRDLNIGYPYPIGHFDFYPNGGKSQPCCSKNLPSYFIKFDFIAGFYALIPSFCSHLQSWELYKVSVNPCCCEFVGMECKDYETFKAGKCRRCKKDGSNCLVMGMNLEYYKNHPIRNHTRRFYLDTSNDCPYCDNSCLILNGYPKCAIKKDPGKHCFHPNSDSNHPNTKCEQDEEDCSCGCC